jgi:hypothetical protein
MPKFIITWDAGGGNTSEAIEAPDLSTAEIMAYENWQQEAESYAFYEAVPYSEEAAEDLL